MIELITVVLLAGAVLYHSIGIPLVGMAIISALTSAFFFIYFLSRKGLVTGLLIGIVLFLGAVTFWYHSNTVTQTFFADRIITGTIKSVDRRLDKTLLVVRDRQFDQLIQVTIHSQNNFLPGDTVKVYGTLQSPQDFMTNTGRLFGYHDYLQSKGIVAIVPIASVTLVSSGNFSLTRFATTLRFHIADIFTRYISFPIDGLAAGMLVGYQGGVPAGIQDLFRTTGVLHVLVLSGENITLLALFLSIILKPLPFKLRSFLTGAAIILIVLISGAGVAAIRAGVMGIIALTGGLVRRSYVPLRALTLSIIFFFFLSPETLFTDPGFHLSVLATIFMIVVVPKIEPLFYWLPEAYHLRELVILAIGVPIFMLPYTMYFSGLVPSASPLANIVMAIITPFMMLGGAIVLACSWISPIAQIVGTTVSFVGDVILKLLAFLNTWPQLNTPPLAWWGVIAIYMIFFSLVFRQEFRQSWYDLTFDVRSTVPPPPNSSEPESR
ncbi:MAG: internalization-related competence protein ComEC/Rec2, competence protein ComEC protein [Candidatus Nomurabacteria bacterium]|nr:internalization-related competence protein ComEC/Rec2, competence protein ComEC protein [Candidatus Nomurabacteria bacterium]